MVLTSNLVEVKKHRKLPTDFWTRYFSYFFSVRLVALIQNTKITPNQLTVVGILVGSTAAFVMSLGEHCYLAAGGALIQVAYFFDCADGQLARLKRMESVTGQWLDDMGGVFLWCAYNVGAGYGYYVRADDASILAWVGVVCFLTPFYCLHRKIRDHSFSQKKKPENRKQVIIWARYLKPHPLLLFSIEMFLDMPRLTVIGLSIYGVTLFAGSVSLFFLTAVRGKN